MSRRSIVNRFQGLFFLLAAAGTLSLALSVMPAGAAKPEDDLAKALTTLDADWSKAAVAKDIERVASFYAQDAVAYPPNEPVSIGHSAAKEVWAGYFADPTFTISWKTTHAEVAKSAEIGFTSGTYESTFKGPDGKPTQEIGKYVCIWAKQKDGSWKAVHDIWNSDAK